MTVRELSHSQRRLVDAFARTNVVYGRGERIHGAAKRQVRGCKVTVGGSRGPITVVAISA